MGINLDSGKKWNVSRGTRNDTAMKQNYRITIFTAREVIERNFYKKETAIKAIMEFKECSDDFVIGILSEKTKDKWNSIYSVR